MRLYFYFSNISKIFTIIIPESRFVRLFSLIKYHKQLGFNRIYNKYYIFKDSIIGRKQPSLYDHIEIGIIVNSHFYLAKQARSVIIFVILQIYHL